MEIKMNDIENKIKQFFGNMVGFFNQKEITQENKEKFYQEAVVFYQEMRNYDKQELQKHIKHLEKEAIKNIKDEIATKYFVKSEIAEFKIEVKQEFAKVRSELAEMKAETRQEFAKVRSEIRETNMRMKYYFFILVFLIIILQPTVFEKIQMIFSVAK